MVQFRHGLDDRLVVTDDLVNHKPDPLGAGGNDDDLLELIRLGSGVEQFAQANEGNEALAQ